MGSGADGSETMRSAKSRTEADVAVTWEDVRGYLRASGYLPYMPSEHNDRWLQFGTTFILQVGKGARVSEAVEKLAAHDRCDVPTMLARLGGKRLPVESDR